MAIAACAAGVVAVGRWEASRHAAAENRGLARLRADVGPLSSPSLDGYRHESSFDCLDYRRGSQPLALELCVDPQGRLVEAIRRPPRGEPRIWSLREEPSRATVHVARAAVDRLLRKMGAP